VEEELTDVGHEFLKEFSKITAIVSEISINGKPLEKLRTNTLLEGSVTKLEIAGDTAEIDLRIEEPTVIRLAVPKEIVDEQNIGASSRLKAEVTLRNVSVKSAEEQTGL